MHKPSNVNSTLNMSLKTNFSISDQYKYDSHIEIYNK